MLLLGDTVQNGGRGMRRAGALAAATEEMADHAVGQRAPPWTQAVLAVARGRAVECLARFNNEADGTHCRRRAGVVTRCACARRKGPRCVGATTSSGMCRVDRASARARARVKMEGLVVHRPPFSLD